MTYRGIIAEAMEWLGAQERTWCLGYNTKYSKAAGTLSNWPEDRITEMPLAEALIGSCAIGMALDGKIPMVWLERADFIFLMLDSIVNHADKLSKLSDGLHKPAIIYRICVGNKNAPLFTGPTHTQNPAAAIAQLVEFPVVSLLWKDSILIEYQKAYKRALEGTSTMLFERKDLYET